MCSVAACLTSAVSGCRQKAAAPATGPRAVGAVPSRTQESKVNELKAIHIDGGYGHLRNLSLSRDGELVWSGWSPGRRVASIGKKKPDRERVEAIWRMVDALRVDDLNDSYHGGRSEYKLVFEFTNRRRIVEFAYKGVDDRPEPLKKLLQEPWKTRTEE